jgi:hypothetical protein
LTVPAIGCEVRLGPADFGRVPDDGCVLHRVGDFDVMADRASICGPMSSTI